MNVNSAVGWYLKVLLFAIALSPAIVVAQTELIVSQPIGMDTQLVYPHVSLPGATGIDFSFAGGFAPTYPMEDSHTVVFTFEWGPTATGPWLSSPDNVNTVPGGMTDLFGSGVFHGPDDAPFVAIHFYAGGIMFVGGAFTHESVVVPEPGAIALAASGVVLFAVRRRRRDRSAA